MGQIDFIKKLKEEAKKNDYEIEGMLVAFRKKGKGATGTHTITEDIGITLRLIEEAKIQELKLMRQREQYVDEYFMQSNLTDGSEDIKNKHKYLG